MSEKRLGPIRRLDKRVHLRAGARLSVSVLVCRSQSGRPPVLQNLVRGRYHTRVAATITGQKIRFQARLGSLERSLRVRAVVTGLATSAPKAVSVLPRRPLWPVAR